MTPKPKPESQTAHPAPIKAREPEFRVVSISHDDGYLIRYSWQPPRESVSWSSRLRRALRRWLGATDA